MYALHLNALILFSTVLLVFDIKNMVFSRVSEKMLQGRDFKFRKQAFGCIFPLEKKIK